MSGNLTLFEEQEPEESDIENRIRKFKERVWETIGRTFETYPKEFVVDFVDYWTEYNENGGRKLRFEKEKTWNTKARIKRRWDDVKNQRRYNHVQHNQATGGDNSVTNDQIDPNDLARGLGWKSRLR